MKSFFSYMKGLANEKTQKWSILFLFVFAIGFPILFVSRGAYAGLTQIPATPPTTILPTLPTTPPILTSTTTPTPKATTTPIPSPRIIPNHRPIIMSFSLLRARVNRYYSAMISGYDLDIKDNLNMKITNLPKGISQGPCWQAEVNGRKNISCTISGEPQKAGIYFPRVTLEDNRGGKTQRMIPLFVLPK